MASNEETLGCAGAIAVVVLLIGAVAGSYIRAHYNEHDAVCTVTSKDRGASTDSGSSHYRIYTEQCGTLEDVDSWLRGKTNSADIYGRIQPGHTYRLHVAGWRLGLTSDFPNILAVSEVKP